MAIGSNFGGVPQKGRGPTPAAKSLQKPLIPFGAPKWPVNPWTGKHMPLHKEPAPTAATTTPSTMRLFWTFAAGGDPVEQDVVPANTSGYYWTLATRTDLNNVHSVYMVEAAFQDAPEASTLRLFWTVYGGSAVESNDAPIANTSGYFWTVDHRVDADGEHSVYLIETPFPSAPEPPAASTLRLFWTVFGGVAVESNDAPVANTEGYFWVVDHRVDTAGEHSIYLAEKAFPVIPEPPAASTVLLYWTPEGGAQVQQNTAPANTSNYFWVVSSETDLDGVHSFYFIEKAFPEIPEPVAYSLSFKWNGTVSTCRPMLPAGQVWQPTGGEIVGSVITIFFDSECVSFYDQPGYCPATTSIPMVDPSTGLSAPTNFVDGLWPAGAGTVLSLMLSETGTTETYTVRVDGSLDGPAGTVGVLDPVTGETHFYRVSASGRLEE